ncbi:MerC domain-containing protein [Gammaproteobacteria bacterium]|nr:MerC domain-containing protein [Gammaproteobacteria bacterium]
MMNAQLTSDKLAITLSAVCVAHCFLNPSLLMFSSGFLFSFLENELIHKLILLCTLPISVLALALGYQNHKTINFLLIGVIGLTMLVGAIFLGEILFGEFGEKGLTLIGSIFIAYSHYNNYRICIDSDCLCHDE